MSIMDNASQTGAGAADPNDVVSRPLPPGVHPRDPSEEISAEFGTSYPVPIERAAPAQPRTGRQPWQTENWEATGVFERGSKDAKVSTVQVNANQAGTALACQRTPGRTVVILSVPAKLADGTTVPNGVTFGFSEDQVQQTTNGACGVLNPGDSISLATEAPIWLGLIGGNASGWCQVVELINPPIGVIQ